MLDIPFSFTPIACKIEFKGRKKTLEKLSGNNLVTLLEKQIQMMKIGFEEAAKLLKEREKKLIYSI